MCVDQLFVSPEHEAEGIGRQLLEWAEGYAIAERAAKLQVVVEAENRRALEFYRGRGFTEAGQDLLELRLPESTT
jgi:ribosomal protein S18 acetylase RimI-like enzyme